MSGGGYCKMGEVPEEGTRLGDQQRPPALDAFGRCVERDHLMHLFVTHDGGGESDRMPRRSDGGRVRSPGGVLTSFGQCLELCRLSSLKRVGLLPGGARLHRVPHDGVLEAVGAEAAGEFHLCLRRPVSDEGRRDAGPGVRRHGVGGSCAA